MSALLALSDELRRLESAQPANYPPTSWIWTGDTLADPASSLASIASQLGYSPSRAQTFRELKRKDAEVWLGLFATCSKVHCVGVELPETLRSAIAKAFGQLGPEARFFSNGEWKALRPGQSAARQRQSLQLVKAKSHSPGPQQKYLFAQSAFRDLPSRTFADTSAHGGIVDGGIVGIGPATSFCYWTTEED